MIQLPMPARNEPCPCGSGRKYKHCCYAKDTALDPGEIERREFRRQHDDLVGKLLRFGETLQGGDLLYCAWDVFWGDEGLDDEGEDKEWPEFDPESPHMSLFIPWFLFRFTFGPDADHPDAGEDTTLAESYLASRADKVSEFERSYIQACLEAPLSFVEFTDIQKGESVTVRDLFTGEIFTVPDRSLSETASRDYLTLAQVVNHGGRLHFEAVGAVCLPPLEKIKVLEIRKQLFKERDCPRQQLGDLDLAFIGFYLQMVEDAEDEGSPALHNTDGHAIEFVKLTWEISSAHEAYQALKSLNVLAESDEDNEVAVNEAGQVVSASIGWSKLGNDKIKSFDNTLLGHINISERRIEAEVNSRERAKLLRAEISQRLPQAAFLQRTKSTSVDTMMKQAKPPSPEKQAELERYESLPEVQTIKRKFAEDHWRTWLDEPIPALGGVSPRKAAKTKTGREQVKVLLTDYKLRSGELSADMETLKHVEAVAKKLGIEL